MTMGMNKPHRTVFNRPHRPPSGGTVVRWVIVILALWAILVTAGVWLSRPAAARWKPEYAELPPQVREWYRTRELTPAARKRLGWDNCCDHADVVRTRFQVERSTGGDIWNWLDPASGQWRRVPDDIIHWNESAPDGRPTLFVYQGRETCFFPGASGN